MNQKIDLDKYRLIPIENKSVTIEEKVEQHEKNIKSQGKLLNWTFGFIIAILVMCVISYVTFLLDAWRFHITTLENFNDKIDTLEKDKIELESNAILKTIEEVKNNTEINKSDIEKIKNKFFIK